MVMDPQRAETLRALRRLCGTVPAPLESTAVSARSSGISALDALLPDKGIAAGSLVEWIVPGEGSGAALVALQTVRVVANPQQLWAVIDPAGEFHPPAASGWGIPLDSLLLLRPSSNEDAAWSVEQCLRCPAVAVTWFSPEQVTDRVVQRWKRAVEVGGGIGMLFRSMKTVCRASWADIRWSVQPRPGKVTAGRVVRVELLFCRGSFAGGGVDLELHDATGDVHLVPSVAHSASVEYPARA